ncbi:hypothetical protein [[Eubacterium] hominis]|uniref:hypothetical protein n=1 Tax=[Eubacterium] hominis TaxID=2764325 RepID=UPI003A4E36DB
MKKEKKISLFPYAYPRALSEEEIQENIDYENELEQMKEESYALKEQWDEQQKLDYLHRLFDENEFQQIADWIKRIGLDNAFQKTYALFGNSEE